MKNYIESEFEKATFMASFLTGMSLGGILIVWFFNLPETPINTGIIAIPQVVSFFFILRMGFLLSVKLHYYEKYW